MSYASNAGTRLADGDFIAFCHQDDIVSAGWLAGMAEAAERCDIVGAVWTTNG